MNHPFVVATRESVKSCKGHWARLAELAGVSHSWLSQFAREEINNPTIDTLQAVAAASQQVLFEIGARNLIGTSPPVPAKQAA